MVYRQVHIWGDSILKGVVYDAARGRYSLLKESVVSMVTARLPMPLINHSQMGRTAPEGLAVLRDCPDDLDGALVVLEYGGNDCDLNWAEISEHPYGEHLARTPAEAFLFSLTQLISAVRERGGTPILCTLPPLNAERYLNWVTKDGLSRERILSYLGETARIYRWQEYYSSMVTEVAHAMRCRLLPVRDAFLSCPTNQDVMCLDGIHPNQQGHLLMADVAVSAIDPLRFA